MKKILIAGLVIALVAIVAVGAVIRTNAQAPVSSVNEANGTGEGNRAGNGWGQNQTPITNWKTMNGSVTSMDPTTLIIKLDSGVNITVENRPWSYALEQKFSANVGDKIAVTGFDYNGTFEVSKLQNATTGKTIVLRDEYGRPGWSGRGRNNGG